MPKFKLQLLKLPKGKCHLQDNPLVDGSNDKTVFYIYIYMFGLIINFFPYKLYCTYIKKCLQVRNKESFSQYYEMIILVGVWLNKNKTLRLYSGLDTEYLIPVKNDFVLLILTQFSAIL